MIFMLKLINGFPENFLGFTLAVKNQNVMSDEWLGQGFKLEGLAFEYLFFKNPDFRSLLSHFIALSISERLQKIHLKIQ